MPPTRLIKAIVFDMDGLIFDTEKLYIRSETELLARRNKVFTIELAQKMMGMPATPAIELLRAEHELAESADELLAECREIFMSYLEPELTYMPGFEEFFESVEASGFRRALATSTNRPMTTHILRLFQLEPGFEFVLTGDDVEHGKPHPDIYQLACERLELSPNEVLVLEDSENGVNSAKAAGCHCAAVPHEHSRSADLSRADLVVEGLMDTRLTAYLEQLE